MKRRNNYTALLIPFFIAVLFNLPACYKGIDEPVKQPVYIEYFKNGQILLLDMAIPDTLIVTDAEGLNKAIAPIEQGFSDFGSDKDISDLFYKYCKIK
jgi:hypothetical protein